MLYVTLPLAADTSSKRGAYAGMVPMNGDDSEPPIEILGCDGSRLSYTNAICFGHALGPFAPSGVLGSDSSNQLPINRPGLSKAIGASAARWTDRCRAFRAATAAARRNTGRARRCSSSDRDTVSDSRTAAVRRSCRTHRGRSSRLDSSGPIGSPALTDVPGTSEPRGMT